MSRLKIYVAGPLSNDDYCVRMDNVRRAIDAGIVLMQAGFAPFVPHLTHYLDVRAQSRHARIFGHSEWLAVDFPWLESADAVLRLSGPSKGADAEVALANDLGISVYHDLDCLISNPPEPRGKVAKALPGDQRFHDLLRQIGELHARKAADYGRGADPLANCRASAEWGIPDWLGVMIRLGDKVHRLKSFAQNGSLANEGVEDSLLDLASYALIALLLYRESKEARPGNPLTEEL